MQPKLPLPCIDEILEIKLGESAIGVRDVNPAEPFFVDHFVNFPVLPGVLMLEGLSQLSSWHIRLMEDFKNSQIRMTECSPAKFSQLVRPGDKIQFESMLMSQEGQEYKFKGKVTLGDKNVATARFKLKSESLLDVSPNFSHLEADMNAKYRVILNSIYKK
ncbi:MAG: 3-hydroxyacyl-[acyl-carrier-protein] dehydratase [Candidatus Omnitrophota bacterium]|jgi:3-hydroxyacyl-[acyl-carrier-protein] dehydratase